MINLLLITDISVALLGISVVFAVLVIVMLVGNLLIRITNKLPSKNTALKKQTKFQAIPDGVVAALVATVNIATGGRGVITEIKNQRK
ncbi:MAG: OadG family protein [Bacteroidales bacterium]